MQVGDRVQVGWNGAVGKIERIFRYGLCLVIYDKPTLIPSYNEPHTEGIYSLDSLVPLEPQRPT